MVTPQGGTKAPAEGNIFQGPRMVLGPSKDGDCFSAQVYVVIQAVQV